MPWEKVRNHPKCPSKVAVVQINSREVAGCHDSEERADAQIRALYANEEATVALVEALEAELAALACELGEDEPTPTGADVLDPRIVAAFDRLSLVTQRDRFEGYKLGLELGLLSQEEVFQAEGRVPPPPVVEEKVDEEERITLSVVQALDSISERLAAGERLSESMLASLKMLAQFQEAPTITVPVTVEPAKVEPHIEINVPEQPAPQVTVEVPPPGARDVIFERDARGKIIRAEIDEASAV